MVRIRAYNWYNVFKNIKAGNVSKRLQGYLKKYGLIGEYETFREFQKALLENLSPDVRKRAEKFLKLQTGIYLTVSGNPLKYAKRLYKNVPSKGNVITYARANAFFHVPYVKRGLVAMRFESPAATLIYSMGGISFEMFKKLRYSYEGRYDDAGREMPADLALAEGLLSGEIRIVTSKSHQTIYNTIASLKLKHYGPYAIEAPPEELMDYFENLDGKYKLKINLTDRDKLIAIPKRFY